MTKLTMLKNMSDVIRQAFHSVGIETFEQLSEQGATKADQKSLAARTGLTEREIQTWVQRIELLRIKGMGQEYTHLLEAAGIDTMKELSGLLPSSLFSKLVMLNRQENYVRRMPSEAMVENWVLHARELIGKVK